MLKITWEDLGYGDSVDDYATICKKDRLIIFGIMKTRDCYYADYFDNRLFKSPRLTYYEAAKIAKEKLGGDSLENRLAIAKDFFIKNYQEQIFNIRQTLDRMDIE